MFAKIITFKKCIAYTLAPHMQTWEQSMGQSKRQSGGCAGMIGE